GDHHRRRRGGQGGHGGGLGNRDQRRRAGLRARDPPAARRTRQALHHPRRVTWHRRTRSCASTCWSKTCSRSSLPTWAPPTTPRAGGCPPFAGEHSLIVEVAPALAIERVTDLALRAVPTVEPGILFVERQFGVLEVHGDDLADVERAGQAILAGLDANPADQLRPRILFSDIIEDLTDRQAVIINRNRGRSIVLPRAAPRRCHAH